MKPLKHKKKYMIILFLNKKIIKTFHNTMRRGNIMDKWHELKTEHKPIYTRIHTNRSKYRIYELALIFPMDKRSKPIYTRDDLGRNEEVMLESKKHRAREIIPYWVEEIIYNFQTKKHIRYHEFVEIFSQVTEISQIFKINNKIVLQIDDDVQVFGNKNNFDSNRLFDILREDLLNRKCGNFIFIKDVSTIQRMKIYKQLIEKGFSRENLHRHYSY